MKNLIALFGMILLTAIAWFIVGIAIKILMLSWPESFFFKSFDIYLKKGIEMLFAPGIASYTSLYFINKYLDNANIQLVSNSFIAIITVLFIGFSVVYFSFVNNPDFLSIFGILVLSLSFIGGAYLYLYIKQQSLFS